MGNNVLLVENEHSHTMRSKLCAVPCPHKGGLPVQQLQAFLQLALLTVPLCLFLSGVFIEEQTAIRLQFTHVYDNVKYMIG